MNFINLTDSMIKRLEDPNTDPRLLPKGWKGGNNDRRIGQYKIALRKAIKICISTQQRRVIELYYWEGLSKSQIAEKLGLTRVAVCKSFEAAHLLIKGYVELHLSIYDDLEREFVEMQQ